MKHYLFAHWVLPVHTPPIHQGFVAIENDRIAEVGHCRDLPQHLQPSPTLFSATNPHVTLLTPGLINTHTHLEHTYPNPIAIKPTETMADWLAKVVQQTRAHQSPPQQAQRCLTGAQEMLTTGTTCINDISSTGQSISALQETGLRGVVSMEFFHPAWEQLHIEPILERYTQHFTNTTTHSRIRFGLSPHSPYNVSPRAWKAVLKELRTTPPHLIHTHVAESHPETDWILEKPSEINILHTNILNKTFVPEPLSDSKITGRTYHSVVQYLSHHDLLSGNLLVAHGIHTSASDRQLLQKSGVSLSHCLRSNLWLHKQSLHWPDWEGLTLSLGTDSRLSTPDLDLRNEAREVMLRHGISEVEVLKLLTTDAAKVLNWSHDIGTLEPQKQADIVAWTVNTTEKQIKKESLTPEQLWLSPHCQPHTIWIAGHISYQPTTQPDSH